LLGDNVQKAVHILITNTYHALIIGKLSKAYDIYYICGPKTLGENIFVSIIIQQQMCTSGEILKSLNIRQTVKQDGCTRTFRYIESDVK